MVHPVFSFDAAGGDVGGEKVREMYNKKKMRIVARDFLFFFWLNLKNSERKHKKWSFMKANTYSHLQGYVKNHKVLTLV